VASPCRVHRPGWRRYFVHASNYLGDGRHAPPEIITRNMEEGATGMRAGRGFHDWSGRDLDAYRNETLTRLVGLLQHLALMPKPE
jgi:3-hydroxybutyryl-CoA dehydrogenase